MSRSGYSDDCDGWAWIRWRGAVASALRGKKGQHLLKQLADGMDAMPEKRLIADELESDGDVCALGVVGRVRGIDMEGIDPYDRKSVAKMFGIADAMAAEVMFVNDDYGPWETPEQRWTRVRRWVASHIARVAEDDR